MHAVDSWEKRPGLDITPLIAALSQGKMERAGHDPRPGQPWGGLQHGRALLVRRGRSGWELVLIGMHPCADQARACRIGQAEEGMLPFGTQQVVAAAAAVIAPACPFPPPERMPKLFIDGSHGRSVRQNCLGCRFYLNVQRVEAGQAVQLLGPGPCYGECALRGLLGLSKTQHARFAAACRAGRFSATEMAWVLWSGALPHGAHMLSGLRGVDRDARLLVLMAQHTPTVSPVEPPSMEAMPAVAAPEDEGDSDSEYLAEFGPQLSILAPWYAYDR